MLIGGNGEHAYLTDFGLTKQAASQSGLTSTGMFVGTLDYIAPEQIQGGQVDARADVYALGCVLFQALTGQVPFPRETEPAKMWAHMSEPPPSLRDVAPQLPAPLDEVVAARDGQGPRRPLPVGGRPRPRRRRGRRGPGADAAERSVATGEAAPTGAGPSAAPAATSGPDPAAAPSWARQPRPRSPPSPRPGPPPRLRAGRPGSAPPAGARRPGRGRRPPRPPRPRARRAACR